MSSRIFAGCAAVFFCAASLLPGTFAQTSAPSAADNGESRFISNVVPLTLTSPTCLRSGEGYFSADGTQMVFQSERDPENPFYQIYLMDFEDAEITLISPGHGKTTCAWIHPDGERILFASTHDDSQAVEKQRAKIAERESGQEGRYNWDYDEHYELYSYEPAHDRYTQLTKAVGYDAEGSYSPDGSLVAFASNRRAYQPGELSDAEQRQFEFHQASAMDIYIMNADGTDVRRLTNAPGYDGGPFFSPDGQRICWRRFAPDMSSGEIWTMNIDGSDPRQLTQLSATSFAPYYHPSGQYLLFMSNLEGYGNFEIYMIPVDRRSEPVRVTYTESGAAGFDGFPTFSPDGKTFSWTCSRTDKKPQIHRADWNHEAALAALGIAEADDVGDATMRAKESVADTAAGFEPQDVLRHVDYLCREDLGGRLTGSRGERMATAYVAAYLDSLGFVPAGDVDPSTGRTSWFQEFVFPSGAELGTNNELVVNGEKAELNVDWRPLSYSGVGRFAGPVVFAGYGMDAPKAEEFAAYDSFVHLDVTDKWVVVFRFMPEDVSPEWRQARQFYSQLRMKAAQIRERGGRGMIIVSGPNSKVKQQLIPLTGDSALEAMSIPVISISDELASRLMATAEQQLSYWQNQLDNGEPKLGFEFPAEVTIEAQIEVEQKYGNGRNVIGRLQMSDEPAEQAVMVGAHIDHLGRGAAGTLARDDEEKQQIHRGADDNASGVAAMLEVAQYLSDQKRQGKLDAQRDVLVAAWSGEELGLHGSRHYVKHHLKQLNPTAGGGLSQASQSDDKPTLYPSFVAYLNMDMVGRFDKKLVLQGLGSSDYWTGEIERRNLATGIPIQPNQDTNLPTDATEFYQAGVPILSAFTGSHQDYHTPRDTPEKLNYEMAAKIAKLMGLITRSLAQSDEIPEYKQHQSAANQNMRVSMRASLGTSPDYAEEVAGVKLKSVRKDSPADKAGLLAGDIVVELAGKKVENIYDYSFAISALKVGDPTPIVVMRKGQRIELKVVPESSQ